MFKRIAYYLIVVLFFTGCFNQKHQKPLTIVSSAWIGYAPIFYAKEKGYLDELNIKVIPVVSLAEAADTFATGKADMVTATQHEYYKLKKEFPGIRPVILLDRSNGGDMILSNKTTKELKKAKNIQAYLEVDSINMDVLDEYLKNNKISKKNIRFHNTDQSSLQSLKYTNKPTLIVTYTPYDYTFKKEGYFEVASTKNLESIIVVDALFTTKTVLKKNRQRIEKLKKIIDRSIKELSKDKKNSYKIVAPYLDNISYKEYIKSFVTIKWINNPAKNIISLVQKRLGYETSDIIK